MKKSDCLGIDKNGAWQVLQSNFNKEAEDFTPGDVLFVLDNNSDLIDIYTCNYNESGNKWGSL